MAFPADTPRAKPNGILCRQHRILSIEYIVAARDHSLRRVSELVCCSSMTVL